MDKDLKKHDFVIVTGLTYNFNHPHPMRECSRCGKPEPIVGFSIQKEDVDCVEAA